MREQEKGNSHSKEFKILLLEELEMLREKLTTLENHLTELFLQNRAFEDGYDDPSSPNAILEIRAGTGGTEASLFTFELWTMYQKYAQLKGWVFKPLSNTMEESLTGLREGCALITGPGAFDKLKFEGGVHRVQRVPVTDNSGRMHTSTATVAVLDGSETINAEKMVCPIILFLGN